jgi:hypothetical protein
MRRLVTCTILLLAALPVTADWRDSQWRDVESLGILYQVREQLVDRRVSDWDVSRFIDREIDRLLEPLPGGGHAWVVHVRPDSEVVRSSGHLVRATIDQPATYENAESWVYAVRLVVPRKRSLFRGNNAVWVDRYHVMTVEPDGTRSEREIEIGRWMQPGSSTTLDLETIASNVRVVAWAATAAENRGEALLEIHMLKSVTRDDPRNPYHETIAMLRDLRRSATPGRVDSEIERLERRVFPGKRPMPVGRIVELLAEAQALLEDEDPAEREKAGAVLERMRRLLEGR